MGKSDLFHSLLPIIFLFARLCGFFLISPFFSSKSIGIIIRIGCAIACSLILVPYAFLSHNEHTLKISSHYLLAILIIKEIAIGYLIGFVFSLLIEAAAFAGQFLGILMGFSAMELFDPISSSQHPFLARFFSLLTFTLILTLDLHHQILFLFFESMEIIPLDYPFTDSIVFGLIKISSSIFHYFLEWFSFPFTLLLTLISIFALISRFFPIFWIGFPIQLIVGITTVAIQVSILAPLLRHAFFSILEFVKKFIVNY